MTAAHVVDGCSSLQLESGEALEIVGVDKALDLAVLSSSSRSQYFLPLDSEESAKLGEDIFALGFPYRGLLDQGLTVTGGNVGALPGALDSAKRLMITAPVQPGNSGGPILNRDGRVVGVVVSRFNDLFVLEQTGSLPQNINFAVSNGPLIGFLEKHHVFYANVDDKADPISNGVPEQMQKSVVSVLCH
ncbi:serine protease [Vannielia litorea]|nr:serine protease [Vannielia litorea]MBY6077289.1 serine protease [Vannielia litorea]